MSFGGQTMTEPLRRVLVRTWSVGVGDVPPAVVPYLVFPWVVASDRLQALGWTPIHTNEETILETGNGVFFTALNFALGVSTWSFSPPSTSPAGSGSPSAGTGTSPTRASRRAQP